MVSSRLTFKCVPQTQIGIYYNNLSAAQLMEGYEGDQTDLIPEGYLLLYTLPQAFHVGMWKGRHVCSPFIRL